MREKFKIVAAGDGDGLMDNWITRALTLPAISRGGRIGLVALYVLGIGLVDYVTGTAMSMQVFYLIPIALALVWLGFFAAFATAVCSIIVRFGGDFVQGADYTRSPTVFWNMLGFLGTYMAVAWVLQALVRLRHELEARVESRTAALAAEVGNRIQLQQELIEFSERERRAIGNDLHDGLGQHLTAMAFAAEVLSRQIAEADPRAAATAGEIGRLAQDGIMQSRQLARGLLLTAITPDQLNHELEELVATVGQQSGVPCTFESAGPVLVADTSTASHLFRIAQEAMRNAVRHAKPTALTLSFTDNGNVIELTVRDNGTGLPLTPNEDAGVGLRVMEHRAKVIGGEFRLESVPGQGTVVCCRIPVPSPPSSE